MTPWRSCQRLIIYTEAMHDLLYADIRNTPHFEEVIIYDDAKPIFGETKSNPGRAPILRHESRNKEK